MSAMSGCTHLGGFFERKRCGAAPAGTCALCNAPICARHTVATNGQSACPACAAIATDAVASSAGGGGNAGKGRGAAGAGAAIAGLGLIGAAAVLAAPGGFDSGDFDAMQRLGDKELLKKRRPEDADFES